VCVSFHLLETLPLYTHKEEEKLESKTAKQVTQITFATKPGVKFPQKFQIMKNAIK
jgi:hypothetical protein